MQNEETFVNDTTGEQVLLPGLLKCWISWQTAYNLLDVAVDPENKLVHTSSRRLTSPGLPSGLCALDDADDELQSKIEACHASNRIQHRGSHRAQPGMVTASQRKEHRVNTPHHERKDNQTSTAHKQ
jgi:hypothetical protein